MKLKETKTFKAISLSVVFSLLLNMPLPVASFAQNLELTPANQFISLSSDYSFPVLKGLRFDPHNPLRMEFIIDTADKKDISKEEASNLIRYFLAGLTVPEEDIWVNLSPYEEDKIITANLGQTDLGKDLLSQDYLLKQLLASLTYPESDSGRNFWEKTYAEVFKIAKTTNLPINTFNKIWIVPDEAEVYENGTSALITKATLKTMLEEDYLALKNKSADIKREKKAMNDGLIADINQASSRVMKDVVLPKVNKDVNQGKNFAQLRQIYHSLVLGIWFKKKFKDSLYAHYINKGKIAGIDLADKDIKDKIYNHYVEAFKTGLYNYVKTDREPQTLKRIKRRYYSGGTSFQGLIPETINELPRDKSLDSSFAGSPLIIRADIKPQRGKSASPITKEEVKKIIDGINKDTFKDSGTISSIREKLETVPLNLLQEVLADIISEMKENYERKKKEPLPQPDKIPSEVLDTKYNLVRGAVTMLEFIMKIQKAQTVASPIRPSASPLTQPQLNFAGLKALEGALKDIVEVTPGAIKVINEAALRNELIDKLVYDATFNPNQDVVNETRKLIKGIAVSLGSKPASVYNLYVEKAKDPRHYTIPAINIRGMAYNTARAVFQSAIENRVTDPFILEIAKSEIGYTAQRPIEYTTSILAAAIKEGYKLPVYLQGDHFQITAKEYKESPNAAIEKIQRLIREAIEAGFYQIDLDMSTLVDWSKPTADEQQKLNYEMTAKLTGYVRQLERELGLDKQGIVVNLGGEIGEIGMGLEKGKERNSSVEDLRAFMNGYNAELERLSKEAGFQLQPITKVAVQSGTKHGGVRDAKGNLIKAKVGFNTLAELGKAAREEFGLAGVVQHGASTLPEDYFTVFAGNKMPAGLTMDESLLSQQGQATLDKHPVAEVHLATAYQDTILDHPEFPADLREAIMKLILEYNPPKEGQDPNKVFVDNRKNAWGPFKMQTWNIPANIQDAIRNSLKAQFEIVFKNLGVASSAISSADKEAVKHWIDAAIEAGATPAMVPEGLRNAEEQKREYVIGGNWKMNVETAEEARQLMRDMLYEISLNPSLRDLDPKAADIVIPIAPSFVHLQAAANEFKNLVKLLKIPEGLVVLAAQDVSAYDPTDAVSGKGAHTGEVSAQQLKDLGVEYVIVGHSEKRRHPLTPESSESVNLKAKQALKYGIRPVVAVGETLKEQEDGRTYKVISEQVLESIKDLTAQDMKNVVIAYEPVWAIGTGKTATPEQANEVQRFIRALILEKHGDAVASKIRIQYGGSMNEKNIGELIAQPNIDGGLIGGASLKPKEFTEIVVSSLKHFKSSSSALEAVTPQANKAGWTKGGIDMQGIDIGTTPSSLPVNFNIPFDVNNFSGFSFQIVSLEKIEDLESVFVASPKKEGRELAYLR